MVWTLADLPDLTGSTIVVTGANSGIGLGAARALAGRNARVIMACRSPEKGRAALDGILSEHPHADASLERLDLSDLASVRAFVDRFSERHAKLDVLVNNAGVMALPYQKTPDGFEMQIGTNHLGHFALTGLLFDRLLAAQPSRVVTVSSMAHHFGSIRLGDLQSEKGYSRWPAYAQSKLANLLFAKELARRVEAAGLAITSAACHPGYASTNLLTAGARIRRASIEEQIMTLGSLLAQSSTWGAMPTLYACTAADVRGGDYYGPNGVLGLTGFPVRARQSGRANDRELAAKLWEKSEALTGVKFTALPTSL